MLTCTQPPTHASANSHITHSEAKLSNVQVELGRVEINKAEQSSQYPRSLLTSSAEHVRIRQGAVQTVTQITQAVHQALRAAWAWQKHIQRSDHVRYR